MTFMCFISTFRIFHFFSGHSPVLICMDQFISIFVLNLSHSVLLLSIVNFLFLNLRIFMLFSDDVPRFQFCRVFRFFFISYFSLFLRAIVYRKSFAALVIRFLIQVHFFLLSRSRSAVCSPNASFVPLLCPCASLSPFHPIVHCQSLSYSHLAADLWRGPNFSL